MFITRDEKVQEALAAASDAQESYRLANGTYASDLSALGVTVPDSVAIAIVTASETSYVMTGQHQESPKTWCMNSDSTRSVEAENC